MNIGKMLRTWRTEQGMTLKQMQEETGVDFRALSRIERGEECSAQSMLRLIHYLFH